VAISFNGSNNRKWESSSKPPRRVPNAERRTREFLTPEEVEKLINTAQKVGRYGHRDATMFLIAYRHGLRVSELCSLRWEQVDFSQGLLHVTRVKHGNPASHPLRGPELRALRRLQRESQQSPYVFTSERKGPMTTSGVRKIVNRAGLEAGIPFLVHPHQLRHATGYYLANSGQDTRAIQAFLGHRCITHTMRYTELSPERFKSLWQD
jgi:type 1 fimbriae regulatory protein FimB/type 1 fimbriae regulatory protein FimE